MLKDRVAGFVLTDAVLGRYPNESAAIAYLQVGLGYLDQQVEQVEARLRKKLREAETVTWLGGPPWPKDVPRELLTCAFHWYAASACHLVKLIGWLHQQVDAAAPDPEDYLKVVLPEVRVWRNKIAAHLARHRPKDEDTEAEGAASVLAPIGFENGALHATADTLGRTQVGGLRTSKAIRPWSLTKVHLGLLARYGP
jgi:hypothetical protein